MPSDHTMFMVFATAYASCFVYHRADLHRRSKFMLVSLMVLISAVVGYSRIYLGVHSSNQVAVGALLGLIGGIIWFRLSSEYLLKSKGLARVFYKCHDLVHDAILGSTRRKNI